MQIGALKINFRHIIAAISILFMAGAAANTGITGPILGFPFLIVFVVFIWRLPIKQIFLFIIVAIIITLPLGLNHRTNKLIYPMLGSRVEFRPGWEISWSSQSKNSRIFVRFNERYLINDSSLALYPLFDKILKEPMTVRLTEIEAQEVAEISTTYALVFEDILGNKYKMDRYQFKEAVESNGVIVEDKKKFRHIPSKLSIVLGDLMYYPLGPLVFVYIYEDLNQTLF